MAMPGIDSITSLKDRETYPFWKFQVQNFVQAKGALGHLLGTERKPDNQAELLKWLEKDGHARSIISVTVSQDIMTDLFACETSNAMWVKLAELYSQKSEDEVDNLYRKLYALQLSESTIPEYIQQIKNMVSKIKASGETLTDRAIMPVILKGLPDEEAFRTFKGSWALLPTTEKTLKNLYEKLLVEEERLRDVKTESAFVAQGSKSKKYQKNSTEHQAKDKYNKKKDKLKKNKDECFKCGEKGHFKINCPKNKKKTGDSEAASTFVCAMEVNVADSSDSWIADSGASFHIVKDREAFWKLDKSRGGEMVYLADNHRVKSRGIGQVKIESYVNGKWALHLVEDVRWVPEIKKNLFAFNAAARRGNEIVTTANQVKVLNKGKVVAIGTWDGSLYKMPFRVRKPAQACVSTAHSLKLLHERMGHANSETLKRMISNQSVTGLDKITNFDSVFCEACTYVN